MTTAKPTDAVLVRPVRQDDRTSWLRLWADYNAYGVSGGTVLLEVTEATWARFFHENEPMEALVAELEGRLVGLAHMYSTAARVSPGRPAYSRICS
jgi:hypothetical protein